MESINYNKLITHPHLSEVFEEAFDSIISESERGAVLISAEIIEKELEKLLLNKSPQHISKKFKKKLFNYPGTLDNFSSKLDVTYLVGLIDKDLYNSIKSLKKLRDKAAHSKSDFKVSDYKDLYREVLSLTPDSEEGFLKLANDFLIKDAIEKVWSIDQKNKKDKKRFENKSEVERFISDKKFTQTNLQKDLPKATLAICLVLIILIFISISENLKNK